MWGKKGFSLLGLAAIAVFLFLSVTTSQADAASAERNSQRSLPAMLNGCLPPGASHVNSSLSGDLGGFMNIVQPGVALDQAQTRGEELPELFNASVDSVVEGLALRTGPYLGASLVNVLRPGRPYTVSAQNSDEVVFTWYLTTVPSTGQVGWASGRYLRVGDPVSGGVNCTITPALALWVIQQLFPQFEDIIAAYECVVAVQEGDATGITVECGGIIADALGFGLVFDAADILLTLDEACSLSNVQVQCTITPSLALWIIQQLFPQFSDAITAYECVLAVANDDFTGAAIECGGIIGQALGVGIIFEVADIAVTLDEACSFNSSGGGITDPGNLPVLTTVFDTLDTLADTGVIAAPRSTMNIRLRPSTRMPILGQMPWGDEAQLLARTVQDGEDFWYLVRYEETIGWIYAPYVSVRGDIRLVPVY